MTKSELPSEENLESQEILSSEPLGNSNPLLPQFLVPLGAQSISVLQPKIFSPKLIADFSGTTFEDSPFFDEFHPQISAKTETQAVQRNSETKSTTFVTQSLLNGEENINEHSSFDITTQANPIDMINRENDDDEFKTPLKTQNDKNSPVFTEIKSDFSAVGIQKIIDLQNPSLPKDINIQTKSESSTSPAITNQVGEGLENTTFSQESELTAPQISQSDNLNQLQPSLSSEVVENNNLVNQQATDIISKSQSSSPEITNRVGEGFQNTTFPQESELTTPQISQSENLNQLQPSLSSEVVENNNLVNQQATDIINKSQSSTPAITNQVGEEIGKATSREKAYKSTAAVISQ